MPAAQMSGACYAAAPAAHADVAAEARPACAVDEEGVADQEIVMRAHAVRS